MDVYSVWGVTVVPTRYQGVYEGGRWAAFPADWRDLPTPPAPMPHLAARRNGLPESYVDAFGEDVDCVDWWTEWGGVVGVGETPNEAVEDLRKKRPELWAP